MFYYKTQKLFYYKMPQNFIGKRESSLIQNSSILFRNVAHITNRDGFIIKRGMCYKVRWLLETSAT